MSYRQLMCAATLGPAALLIGCTGSPKSRPVSAGMSRILLLFVLLAAAPARASFLSGDALDTAADIIAIVVLILVPAVVIVVFWMVHVLPEKIAHRRHH